MRTVGLVVIGGAIGATGRLLLTEWMPGTPGDFPWATLVANLAACLAIGWATVSLTRSSDGWRFWVTGVLGGLSTASTFAVETRELLVDGRAGLAAVYIATSAIGGVFAVEVVRGAMAQSSTTASS